MLSENNDILLLLMLNIVNAFCYIYGHLILDFKIILLLFIFMLNFKNHILLKIIANIKQSCNIF